MPLAFRSFGTRESPVGWLSLLQTALLTRLVPAEILKPSAMKANHERLNARSSSDESREVVVALPEATEWQYRGRAGHEIGTPQPLSAPPGLAAQKDEGFQKFYKAVVSPTHVRVTAGGRIVPNTRGPQSPNVKESVPETAQAQPQQNIQTNAPAQESAQAATPVPLPLGYPAAFPGYPAGMFPNAQLPIPHIPLGFNFGGGFSLPQFAMNRHVSNQSEPIASQPLSHTQGLDGAGGVRISPPGQFDPTRPYFVNGQWMLPLGVQAYQYGLHPFMAHPGLTGHYGSGPIPPGPAPAQTNSYPNLEAQSAQSNGTHATTPVSAPAHPPISSIRPSQITKCHIESLKHNLKRVEDQLQYNVHQIDVKHMEGLAKEIRASIKSLKDALPKQLEFEGLHYPKAEKHDFKPSGELFNPPISHADHRKNHLSQGRKDGAAARAGVNASNGARAVFSTGSGVPMSSSTDSEPFRRFSGLPMTAAAAPPFHPYNNHLASKHTVSSGDDSRDSSEATRNRLSRLGPKGFQAVAMSPVGESRQDSSQGQPKPYANGSPSHAAKAGTDTITTPKSVASSVASPPVCVDRKDDDTVSSFSLYATRGMSDTSPRSPRARRRSGSGGRTTDPGENISLGLRAMRLVCASNLTNSWLAVGRGTACGTACSRKGAQAATSFPAR